MSIIRRRCPVCGLGMWIFLEPDQPGDQGERYCPSCTTWTITPEPPDDMPIIGGIDPFDLEPDEPADRGGWLDEGYPTGPSE
jgi:hypothetical protein